MPSLLQKKDGRWYINYTENGQRKRLYISALGKPVRDAEEARHYYDAWLADHERKQRVAQSNTDAPQSPRVEIILRYCRDTQLRTNNAAEATRVAVQTCCMGFLEFCRVGHIGRMQHLNPEVMAR